MIQQFKEKGHASATTFGVSFCPRQELCTGSMRTQNTVNTQEGASRPKRGARLPYSLHSCARQDPMTPVAAEVTGAVV